MANTTFSKTLQKLRKDKKVTQEQLASYLGVSPQAVSKWENGSYPEGDLLPKLADYFSVSIDYFYGRSKEESSIEQKILEHLKQVLKKEVDEGTSITDAKNFWEELYNIIWAAQISPWNPNNEYFGRMLSDDEGQKAASVMYNNEGYSYMNLDRGNEFYLLLKNSNLDGGFAHFMKYSDRICKLFSELSSKENIRILMYMYTLKGDEYASVDTISQSTGIDRAKVEKLINYMLSDISEENVWKYMFNKIKITNNTGNSDIAYGVDINLAGLMFGLFNIADSLIHNPHGYNMQISNRTKAWIDRNSVK